MNEGSETAMAGATADGPEVNVVPIGRAARRIDLRGPLPAGWAGRLAAGLAAQRIDVVRGWAREEGAVWEAQLQVELPQYTIDLTPATLLQLTEPEAGAPGSTVDGLELLAFRLAPAGEDVAVEIEAADARGFLDRLLRLFALAGMVPREMTIETTEGLVHDVFRLRRAAGGAPAQDAVAALGARLQRVTLP